MAILGLAILIVVAIGSLSYINNSQTHNRILRSRAVREIQKLDAQLLVRIIDAESCQRGFLLTGQEQFLQSYQQAAVEVPQLLSRLESRLLAEPKQAERTKTLRPLVAAKLAELKETIDLSKSDRLSDAVGQVKINEGKRIMDGIWLSCFQINQDADQHIAEFAAASDLSTSRLRIGSTAGGVLLLGLVLLSAIIISRGFHRREELFNDARATRELLSTTLCSIADGVISTDMQGRIIFMNLVAERLTGWREKEVSGRSIGEVFSLISETDHKPIANPLQDALAKGEPVELAQNAKLVSRDHSEIFIDNIASPIRGHNGVLIGAVLVFRDISEKRRSEIHLAEAAAALKRSNEELAQFAYAASHDLRSPLNSVNSIAQLLGKRFAPTLGQEGNEMIGYITEGTGRMSRLIEDLLALALVTGTAGDVSHPTSVKDAYDTALKSLSAELQETGATVTYSAPLPVVAARDTHVVQVLQNIFGNALKYRGNRAPHIHLSATREGAEWILRVKDNGIGFESKYADRIFQPFKRLHGPEYAGSGIGLSTCKRIVSLYGGRIWAESSPGKGSTFLFSMPQAEMAHAANAAD